MLNWRVSALAGLCLTGIPAFASPSSSAALPPDFLSTVREIQAAYTRKDVEGIISHYALDCTFLVSGDADGIHDFLFAGLHKAPEAKRPPKRHDFAGERQELQRIFSDPVGSRQTISSKPLPPIEEVNFTSYVQHVVVSHKATQLRVIMKHKLLLYRGQAVEAHSEVDEEVWGKGAQGWKLRRRSMDVGPTWVDYS